METICKTILPEEEGSTVRHILKAELHFSSHAISRLTRAETGILVNGRRARTTQVLRAGDNLVVETGDHAPPKVEIAPGNWPLPIIWEDGHLLVVNKPAGMTAHASNFLPDTPTVAGALAWQRGPNFIFHPVNRLDKGTTGLMVIAKSGYVHDRLRYALHTTQFYREYRAICIGCPSPPSGVIDAPIGRNTASTVARMIRPDGSPAVTHYEVLSQENGLSLLRLLPETGRTHQLRVHMASLGCPLAGDWLYGIEDPALISRPALHSYALRMAHPVTGELLSFTAPVPVDMLRLFQPQLHI
jgi:23S rRNA pseudouridine1911/1915/1917 synthase